jgi:hypothetical protein
MTRTGCVQWLPPWKSASTKPNKINGWIYPIRSFHKVRIRKRSSSDCDSAPSYLIFVREVEMRPTPS